MFFDSVKYKNDTPLWVFQEFKIFGDKKGGMEQQLI